MSNRISSTGLAILCILVTLVVSTQILVIEASDEVAPVQSDFEREVNQLSPAWMEPRGIGIVELVGNVSESMLNDLIIGNEPGYGVVRYISGSRNNDTVTINAKVEYSIPSFIPCLGSQGILDYWNVVTPAGKMRVYDNNVDVTSNIQPTFTYYTPGLIQPTDDAESYARYPSTTGNITYAPDGSINMPASSGCRFTLSADPVGEVRVVYTFENNPSYVNFSLLHQTTLSMHSYVGPGWVGKYAGLMTQLKVKFAPQLPPWLIRHEGLPWFDQTDAAKAAMIEADYFLVKFDPIDDDAGPLGPVSPPGGGSYRQMMSNGSTYAHSVDHIYGMMIPLHGFWQEPDQIGTTPFLPEHTFYEHRETIYNEFDEIKGPEFIVPPGIPWQACMQSGTCPDALLTQIFNTAFPVEIAFFKVDRTVGGLTQIPLKQAGWGYVPTRDATQSATEEAIEEAPTNSLSAEELADLRATMSNHVYVPLVSKPVLLPEPENPFLDCPCGWFDTFGRMWDYMP